MVMVSRPRNSRSSMKCSPSAMPTRRLRADEPPEPPPPPVGRPLAPPLPSDLGDCVAMSERCLPGRFYHLGQEVLRQRLPFVVYGRGLQSVNHGRLGNLAAHDERLFDDEDFAAIRPDDGPVVLLPLVAA